MTTRKEFIKRYFIYMQTFKMKFTLSEIKQGVRYYEQRQKDDLNHKYGF